jgi:putative tryptophan/tyrosine transport system substrate-binding protein
MNRRRFILAFACSGVAIKERLALSQTRPYRIGFLYFASQASAVQSGRYAALLEGLRSLGYTEGRDFIIEARYGDGKAAVMPRLAAELVAARVDVIVTGGTPAAYAAQRATSTIPVVFASSADPVRDGFVASLARPGGNLTGVTSGGNAEVDVKHVDLLKSVTPGMARVAVLANSANPGHLSRFKSIETAAGKVGIKALLLEGETADAFEPAVAAAAERRAQGLIVLNDTFFLQNERQIAELALKHHLPSICALGSFVDAGGLLSYGPNATENFRHAAVYVDKILRGGKVADLPVERPRTFELAINFKTAQALRLAIPQEMAFMASRAIR